MVLPKGKGGGGEEREGFRRCGFSRISSGGIRKKKGLVAAAGKRKYASFFGKKGEGTSGFFIFTWKK